MRIIKTAERYAFKKEYYSPKTKSKHTASIVVLVTKDADGRSQMTVEGDGKHQEALEVACFEFVSSDPARAEAVGELIAQAARFVAGLDGEKWTDGGKI